MGKFQRMSQSFRRELYDDRGFTVIEALLAMALLGIGLMSIMTLQVSNSNYNSSSRRQTEGYTLAISQVEQLIVADYDTDADLRVGAGHSVVQGPYTVEWNVADNSAAVADTRLVSVSVRHNRRQIAQVDYMRVRETY